jgi:hypothetical protein
LRGHRIQRAIAVVGNLLAEGSDGIRPRLVALRQQAAAVDDAAVGFAVGRRAPQCGHDEFLAIGSLDDLVDVVIGARVVRIAVGAHPNAKDVQADLTWAVAEQPVSDRVRHRRCPVVVDAEPRHLLPELTKLHSGRARRFACTATTGAARTAGAHTSLADVTTAP